MGTWFKFRCPGCGYEVRSSGGPDVLMSCSTAAIVCKVCKEVMDVAVRTFELGNSPPNESPEAKPTCEADPAHKVVRWGRRHPCPKCGKGMDMDERSMILCD